MSSQMNKINISNSPTLSVIVPVRNEMGTIKRIFSELSNLPEVSEIIFIEGHSKDGTWEEIKRSASSYSGRKTIKFSQQTGEGKGDAVRMGFDMSSCDILIIYDGDMSVPTSEIKLFYETLIANKMTIANGSRFIYPMEKRAMRSLNYLANKMFSYIFKWLFKQKITDTLCGTKAIWKEDYEKIKANRKFFGDFDPFGDFDLLFGSAKLGFKIVDVPVNYKERVYGETNISRWKHGWLLLKMTVFAIRKMKFHA